MGEQIPHTGVFAWGLFQIVQVRQCQKQYFIRIMDIVLGCSKLGF